MQMTAPDPETDPLREAAAWLRAWEPEATEAPMLGAGEIITEPIRDIQTAHRLIIEGARTQLLELDWRHYDVEPELVNETFDTWFGMVLRQSPLTTPVSVLSEQYGPDRELIGELLSHQRMALSGQRWFVLLMSEVPPEYATVTRDLLCLKMVECVAVNARLDRSEVILGFARETDGPLTRAAIRLQSVLDDHPELIKEDEPIEG